MSQSYSIGLDFGTESVRALVVAARDGKIAGQAVAGYAHGVLDEFLPGNSTHRLPADYALQHPMDWLTAASAACREAMNKAEAAAEEIAGIGVAFTSCTMLPSLADGTPLCLVERFKSTPPAWPKLWKHHGAKAATDRINAVARQRKEPWLARYGGTIGLEWFFPKILETLSDAPEIYQATQVWLEGGDWLAWQLTDGPFPRCKREHLIRSTCQAGYKAMWNRHTGYPSPEFFAAVDSRMADVLSKMPGRLAAPGERAGLLSDAAAELLGLKAGTPVSTATIDAHAGVPGAGVAENSTMVLVMGTSSCHMLNSDVERLAAGIAGVVEDGILPGSFGYETGQAAVGDALAWMAEAFNLSHKELTRRAEALSPGSGGVLAIDWLNGCRTPLMDGRLSGSFVGITLGTKPEQLYRAMMEATAFGVRWIVDEMRLAGIPVKRFVASGGLPARSPLLMRIYADVLGETIYLAESDQSVALGAAILGCLAAQQRTSDPAAEHAMVLRTVRAMARQRIDLIYQPDAKAHAAYTTLYGLYRSLADVNGPFVAAMRRLREAP